MSVTGDRVLTGSQHRETPDAFAGEEMGRNGQAAARSRR
jgi:hypothetical protein